MALVFVALLWTAGNPDLFRKSLEGVSCERGRFHVNRAAALSVSGPPSPHPSPPGEGAHLSAMVLFARHRLLCAEVLSLTRRVALHDSFSWGRRLG